MRAATATAAATAELSVRTNVDIRNTDAVNEMAKIAVPAMVSLTVV
jgi:hypothetical protein